MTTAIRMPRIGQSMTEGTVVAWLVEEGAQVVAGDALLTVETDKTTFEVEAPENGTLTRHAVAVGDLVPVGELLGELGGATPVADMSGVSRAATAPVERAAAAPPRAASRLRASPKARRLAAMRGINLARLVASRADGLLVARDVERAGAGAPAAGELWRGRRVRERRPLESLARIGARRTHEAWTTSPHFVQMLDVDMGAARALRDEWKRAGGPLAAVSVGDLCVAATARALAAAPQLNASIDGDERVLFAEVNIGIAVDTPAGLTVPVLKRADTLALAALASRSRALAGAAREQRLTPDDFAGGSATVSNLGAYGIRAGTPVLNPPEAVLVFVGAMEDRVVARGGGIHLRPMMTLSIAYDHRVADGAQAARLSVAIRELLEDPSRLL